MMLCKIAELITEIPEAGGLAPRCQAYLWEGKEKADITIRTELFSSECYPEGMDKESIEYMETGKQFYCSLIFYEGSMLHASAVELDGKAYLFSGDSGAGKSTHTKLWQTVFGESAIVFNDDKPALRCVDGKWYAYGTPWCGKDNINVNHKVPLAGICFMKKADHNQIRRLSKSEALIKLLPQVPHRYRYAENQERAVSILGRLIDQIPVFELENRPEPDAVRLSYSTMWKAAKEMAL